MTNLLLDKAAPIETLALAPLMINLGGNASEPVYVNRAKQAPKWRQTINSTWPAANLTDDFEIASLPSGVTSAIFVMFLAPVTTTAVATALGSNAAGQYRMTWTGGPTTCTLTGATADSVGTRSVTFTIASVGNIYATFNSLNTLGFPSGVVFIKVEDQALYDAGTVFHPDFLATLPADKYESIRFLNYQATNDSTETDWADRTAPTAASWGPTPVEVMVDMCNELGIGPWFCMPHLATEDYQTQFATVVKNRLRSDLVARYEWSNEVWNSQFDQYSYALSAGQTLFSTASGDAHQHYYGYRTAQMARVLDAVYGAQRNYIVVAAWQAANSASGSTMLTATRWQTLDPVNYVVPGSVIDEIAIAPYVGNPVMGNSSIWTTFAASGQAAAVAHIDTFMPAELTTKKGYVAAWKLIADSYGIPLNSYENGSHLELETTGNNNLFATDISVPNGLAFTAGERVTQAGTGATALITNRTAGGLSLDTETTAFNGSGALTGATSGVVQTPTAIVNYNPKAGVLDMFEAAARGSAHAARFTEHMTNCRAAGMRFFGLFQHIYATSKYGSWGLQEHYNDTGARKTAVDAWIAANPRWFFSRQTRRAVTWP